MRILAGVIAVTIGLAAAPAVAQLGAGGQSGTGGGTSPWVKKPPEVEAHRPGKRRRHHLYPEYYYDEDGYLRGGGPAVYDRDAAVEPPPEPEEPEFVAPQLPPDPQGPLSGTLARGVTVAPPKWRIGEPLPANLPHVTLDWRRYELPEPPPGRIYARIGRDILIITAGERVVEEVLPRG
jgi:Ni/Co efflux regulator RcnB